MEQKDRFSYKGFEIMIMSFPCSGAWEFKVIIFSADGGFSRDFLSPHAFENEQEALEACLEYGKRIIDEDKFRIFPRLISKRHF